MIGPDDIATIEQHGHAHGISRCIRFNQSQLALEVSRMPGMKDLGQTSVAGFCLAMCADFGKLALYGQESGFDLAHVRQHMLQMMRGSAEVRRNYKSMTHQQQVEYFLSEFKVAAEYEDDIVEVHEAVYGYLAYQTQNALGNVLWVQRDYVDFAGDINSHMFVLKGGLNTPAHFMDPNLGVFSFPTGDQLVSFLTSASHKLSHMPGQFTCYRATVMPALHG